MTDPRPTGDRVLAGRAADGDRHACEELLRRHGDLLWTFALRALGGDHRTAERAAEEAWATAWDGWARHGAHQPVRLWLLAAVARCCEGLAGAATAAPGAPDEPWQVLTAALARLTWRERAAWILHELHDLELDEVAVVLGEDRDTVRARLTSARAALRLELGRDRQVRSSR